jgi:hypothetical protein
MLHTKSLDLALDTFQTKIVINVGYFLKVFFYLKIY